MNDTNRTICMDCDHVLKSSTSRHPSRWQCIMFPRLSSWGFVTGEKWDKLDPFMYCADINGGLCPLWKQRKMSIEEAKNIADVKDRENK